MITPKQVYACRKKWESEKYAEMQKQKRDALLWQQKQKQIEKENNVCLTCGTIGISKIVTKGHGLIEILLWFLGVMLWLFLLVPAIIYSIWRRTACKQTCMKCGSEKIIPLDSPIGKQFHV
jgi:hypothetical protein